LLTIRQWNYQVTFFAEDTVFRPLFDGRVVVFNANDYTNPPPPRALLYEHFKTAVLANMRGAGEQPDLKFDPTDDGQSMSAFEDGEGKSWFETRMLSKLAHLQDENFDLEM